jgi:hypothetical protein
VPTEVSARPTMASPWWALPFRHPRIKACLAAPRGLSQLATSFIASNCQGVHRLPLLRLCGTHSIHLSRSTRRKPQLTILTPTPDAVKGRGQIAQRRLYLPRTAPSRKTATGPRTSVPCHASGDRRGNPAASKAHARRSSSAKPRVSPRTVSSIPAALKASASCSRDASGRSAARIIFRRTP